ncbi:MAG: nucleotide exchange factor GrpE, partial [Candidatus Omnitrophica bacterium]|nr:nucleotide exchange factor GrpE [Candidatus Omnitrophota bacterium]
MNKKNHAADEVKPPEKKDDVVRDDYRDKYVRLAADFDNAVKRMEKDRIDYIRYANDKIIAELFPLLDSFDSAMANVDPSDKDKAVVQGLKLL